MQTLVRAQYILDYEGLTAREVVPPFEIEIADAQTGAPLAIAPYGGSLTYSCLRPRGLGGNEGSAQGTVTPRTGSYPPDRRRTNGTRS